MNYSNIFFDDFEGTTTNGKPYVELCSLSIGDTVRTVNPYKYYYWRRGDVLRPKDANLPDKLIFMSAGSPIIVTNSKKRATCDATRIERSQLGKTLEGIHKEDIGGVPVILLTKLQGWRVRRARVVLTEKNIFRKGHFVLHDYK